MPTLRAMYNALRDPLALIPPLPIDASHTSHESCLINRKGCICLTKDSFIWHNGRTTLGVRRQDLKPVIAIVAAAYLTQRNPTLFALVQAWGYISAFASVFGALFIWRGEKAGNTMLLSLWFLMLFVGLLLPVIMLVAIVQLFVLEAARILM